MKKFIILAMLGLGGALMAAPSDANASSVHIRTINYDDDGHDRGGRHWNRGHDRYWNDHRRYRQPVVYYTPRPIFIPARPVVYVPRYEPDYYQPSGLTINYRW